MPDQRRSRPAGDGQQASAWPSRLARALGLIVLLFVLMVAFLASPRIPRELERQFCVKVHDFSPAFRLIVNCDSAEFLYLARQPWAVLTVEHQLRQNRPVYPLLGFLLAAPLRAGLAAIGVELGERAVPEYIAFVALNALLLIASVWICLRLLAADSPFNAWALLPVAGLVVNELTKPFFWTPHVQIFNIFVPIASVALYVRMRSRMGAWPWVRFAVAGLLLGIAGLAYGAVGVTAIGATLCVLVGDSSGRSRLPARLRHATILALAFLLPIVVWVAFVRLYVGSFFSRETASYRQFVWVLDAVREGWPVLLTRLGDHLALFLGTVIMVTAFPCIALAVAVAFRQALGVAAPVDRELGAGITLYLVSAVIFFAPMGYYATRNSWTLVPPLLLLLGLELRAILTATTGCRRTTIQATLGGLTGLYVAYWIVKRGPWS